MSKRTCSEPDCTKAVHARGLCKSHYMRERYLRLNPPRVLLKACEECGVEFEAPTNGKRFCSERCGRRSRHEREKLNPSRVCDVEGCGRPHRARGLCWAHYAAEYMPDRHRRTIECEVCGKRHVTTRHDGRFCSLGCRDEWRSSQRVKFRIWIPHCEHCGMQFNHDGPLGEVPRFCSSACRGASRKASMKARAPVTVVCRICGTEFEAFTKAAALCSPKCKWRSTANNRGVVSHEEALAEVRECATCGGEFRSPYMGAEYCSSRCRKVLSGWISESRRLGLYERDGWRCYLCGVPVVREGDHNADDYATLDHVFPRSLGGDDSDDNLRTCCRECNSAKSDRVLAEGQLSLFPPSGFVTVSADQLV